MAWITRCFYQVRALVALLECVWERFSLSSSEKKFLIGFDASAIFLSNFRWYTVILPKEKFDKVLSLLNDYRNRNEINITTVQQYLDYRLALENIEWSINSNGNIQLKNINSNEIKGFTFYTKHFLKNANALKITQLKNSGYLYTTDFKPKQIIVVE